MGIRTLEELAKLFIGAPESRLPRKWSYLKVAGNGDCLFACLVCAAFMAWIREGNGLHASEVQKLQVYSIFGARVLKRMFKVWISDNLNLVISSYSGNVWSIQRAMELQYYVDKSFDQAFAG